jgi:hypothetical protein
MAAARKNWTTGESPEHWERPLGTPDVTWCSSVARMERSSGQPSSAPATYQELRGVTAIWRQDCHTPADEREAFGFKDGISHPAIQGSGIAGSNPHEHPLKAGEFVLGYPDEMSDAPAVPQPEVLGRNASYVIFRKLHQRVAAFRRYLKVNATSPAQEDRLQGLFVLRDAKTGWTFESRRQYFTALNEASTFVVIRSS